MKQKEDRPVLWIPSIIMLTGLGLAISDGPWFPIPNLAGVLIFVLAIRVATKLEVKEVDEF